MWKIGVYPANEMGRGTLAVSQTGIDEKSRMPKLIIIREMNRPFIASQCPMALAA